MMLETSSFEVKLHISDYATSKEIAEVLKEIAKKLESGTRQGSIGNQKISGTYEQNWLLI